MTEKRWINGWCEDCHKWFTPPGWATCQYHCEPCRRKPVLVDSRTERQTHEKNKDLMLKPRFLRYFLQKGEGFTALAKRLKISRSASTLQYWDTTGRISWKSGSIELLCKALKMSKTELEQRFGR